MRIDAIELYQYDLTYRFGHYVMSGGRVVTSLASTVVRVIGDDGIDGWAETCPLGANYLPAHSRGAVAALEELAPQLLGLDPTNHTALHQAMDGTLAGHQYAKSAVDIACWDVFGKAVGRPVCDLLGGRVNDELAMFDVVPLGPIEDMVAYLVDRHARGQRRFQVKVGNDPRDDARRVLGVLEAAEEGDVIVADANGGWRRQDAVVAARLLDGADGLLLEQPCPTLDECLAVRSHTDLPFVLDELITDANALIRAAAAGAMEAINLKLNRVGGLHRARFVRDVAVSLGMRLTIEDTWGGDLTSAAVAHLGASTPPASLFAASFMNDWNNEHIAGYEPRSVEGIGAAPNAPGLGVAVDRRQLGAPLRGWRG